MEKAVTLWHKKFVQNNICQTEGDSLMDTQCNPTQIEFHSNGKRKVIGKFDGGNISSDAGGLLLREVERKTRIIRDFVECFDDFRNQDT